MSTFTTNTIADYTGDLSTNSANKILISKRGRSFDTFHEAGISLKRLYFDLPRDNFIYLIRHSGYEFDNINELSSSANTTDYLEIRTEDNNFVGRVPHDTVIIYQNKDFKSGKFIKCRSTNSSGSATGSRSIAVETLLILL